ncbi:MAG: hypothetical protein GXO87_01775 [Chlorobi bacterium]|nr:hypothetical protein [Chlorobiota bacterium]
MKNRLINFTIVSLFAILIISCSEDNTVENTYNDASISIGQNNNSVGIAVTASNAKAATQTAPIIFTGDSVFVNYSVIGYGGGAAYITLSNDEMESETFSLNSGQNIGNRPLSFKPATVFVDIKEGYTGIIAMAITGK